MISAAAGSMSVLMLSLVHDHGIQYLFAATILTGIIQYLMGVFKLGKLMNYVPQGVITGFVNALAILVFMSQLRYFKGESWLMYALVGVTLVIIYVVPKLTKAIPSPLIAVVVMTAAVWAFGLNDVSRIGEIHITLPQFLFPNIPLSWETLGIIFPYALSLAFVGFTESMLTHNLIDEITDEKTDKNKEMRGLGFANVVAGFFGGMAGCALVAESVLNVKMGGRNRLSTLVSALFLLALVALFGKWLSLIPMAALVGIMLMVCISIFDWKSVFQFRSLPLNDTIIMLVTVVAVVLTHNLAIGVIIGVVLGFVWFVVKAAKLQVHSELRGTKRTYVVRGQLFFASASVLDDHIEYSCSAKEIHIDLTDARVWDHSAHASIEKIVNRLKDAGKRVTVRQADSSLNM